VASLSQGCTAAAQCGLFTHKSVPVIFEPPCIMTRKSGLQLVKDDHDWYCFECHAGGDVICCTSCHRVYHVSCLAKEEVLQEDVKNTFVCPVCKVITEFFLIQSQFALHFCVY